MAKKKTKRHGAKDQGANGAAASDVEKEPAGAGAEGDGEREDEAEGSPAEASEKEAEDEKEAAEAKPKEPAEAAPKEKAAADDEPAEAAPKEKAAADDEPAEAAPKEKAAPAKGDESADAPKKPAGKDARKPAAWGAPLMRFEAAWTRFETRLITWVLVAQLLSMVLWVLLSGLSSPEQSGNASGKVMRAVIGMVALGSLGWFAPRKMSLNVRRIAAIAGIVVGAATAGLWRKVGVEYFDNVRAWMQEGSTLTLMGGLRGLATRLTLWLALLGASLATGSGKHINIDVIFRFVPSKFRLPIAVLNYLAAGLMCFCAVWGFFDHIAIESFGANAENTAGEKVSISLDRMGDHLFLTRKQLSLDVKALPHVLSGDRFDQWMSAKAWNEWVNGAGFESKYPPETIDSIRVPDDAPPHTPLVVAPDGEATRGMLVHDLSLVFPFGMLAIALRFVLRALLALSRQIEVDPDAAHKEEIGTHAVAAEPKKGDA